MNDMFYSKVIIFFAMFMVCGSNANSILTKVKSSHTNDDINRITLITGDTVSTDPLINIENLSINSISLHKTDDYRAFIKRGHVYVIPIKAMALLNQDKLDIELFNISKLHLIQQNTSKNEFKVLIKYNAPNQFINFDNAITVSQSPNPSTQSVTLTTDTLNSAWQKISTSQYLKKVWLDELISIN